MELKLRFNKELDLHEEKNGAVQISVTWLNGDGHETVTETVTVYLDPMERRALKAAL